MPPPNEVRRTNKMLSLVFVLIFFMTVGTADPIVNGIPVVTFEYPFIVQLNIISIEKRENSNKVVKIRSDCGGSILTKKTILTAAHCLESVTIPTITVFAGFFYLKDIESQEHPNKATMKNYKIHPDYEDAEIDMALIFLKTDLELIDGKVEAASFTIANVGSTIVIAGWGYMENNEDTDVLRKASMKVVQNTQCPGKFRYNNYFLCIFDSSLKNTFCDGDSGGPIIYNNKLVGVIIYSASETILGKNGKQIKVCSGKKPAVGINVPRFIGWILKNKL